MQETTLAAFQANVEQYYDQVLRTAEPLIIHKEADEDVPGAVLLPQRDYNALRRRLDILGNSQVMRDIREAALQMAAGELIEITDIDAL